MLGAHLAHAHKHVALQEVVLRPVPEVTQEINHAQVVAHTHKAAMVSTVTKRDVKLTPAAYCLLNTFLKQFQLVPG